MAAARVIAFSIGWSGTESIGLAAMSADVMCTWLGKLDGEKPSCHVFNRRDIDLSYGTHQR